MSNKYLIVGLGNVGSEYDKTRHNIGFSILDGLAKELHFDFDLLKYALWGKANYKGKQIVCIKPTTYMNLSGKAVRYYLQKEKIKLENLLILVDDFSLPFGKIRIREKGNAAGHNGLKNIEELLQTDAYARLKFGIGADFEKNQQTQYVLSRFDQDQIPYLEESIKKSIKAVLTYCTNGIRSTMNEFN